MHEIEEHECQIVVIKLSMVKWSMDNRFQLDLPIYFLSSYRIDSRFALHCFLAAQ